MGAFAIVFIAPLDVVIFGNRITKHMSMALLVVILGAVLYSMYDITYNQLGYMWMALNMVFFISTNLLEKYATTATDQTGEGLAMIQNTYTIVIAAAMSLYKAEQPMVSFTAATP